MSDPERHSTDAAATETANPDWLAEQFEDHRARLRAVAYRMLGSTAEAEDTVQDAWLRVARADATSVENLAGWLTTIVARLALDRLRSRAARREEPAGVHLPDFVVTSPDPGGATGPEQEAELADSVGLAMLVVLETLTPPERLAFVLHDTFGLPFEEIAPIVGRTPVAARQLASRARRRVRGAGAEGEHAVPDDRQRELVEAFLAAARGGDFRALLQILDPDAVVRADAGDGTGPFGPSREISGAEAVASSALAFRNLAPGAHRATVNGGPGFVVLSQGRPFAVLGFSFRGHVIAEIDILIDPARLAQLDLSAVVPQG
jgi:RNA polymerase sigma factor (sigma-70 family)